MSPHVNLIKLLVFISNAAINKLEHLVFMCFPDWFNACINVMNKHSNKLIKLLIFVSNAAVNKLEHLVFTCFPDWFNVCVNVRNEHSSSFLHHYDDKEISPCVNLIKLLVFISNAAANKLEYLVFMCFPDWFNVCVNVRNEHSSFLQHNCNKEMT